MIFVHLVYLLVAWRLVLLAVGPVLLAGPIMLINTAPLKRAGKRVKYAILIPCFATYGLIIAAAFFGDSWSTSLVHAYGVDGEAQVTGRKPTSMIYNNGRVDEYGVLIRRKDGGTTETSFSSASFNVWPPKNLVRYPAIGQRFTARYLTGYPDDFIILADDGSDYARSIRCGDLATRLSEARRKTRFSPDDAAFRADAAAALKAAVDAGCETPPAPDSSATDTVPSIATGASVNDAAAPNPAVRPPGAEPVGMPARCRAPMRQVAAAFGPMVGAPRDRAKEQAYRQALAAAKLAGCPVSPR